MQDQLKRLVEAASLPNVSIRVLPYGAGAHAALDSTFIILEFSAPVPRVIYVDGLVRQIYWSESRTSRYRQVYLINCMLRD